MKSIHTFDVFAPTDEQEEAMNKKRGGHYRRGKNKEMDYFIECATSLFPNNHYSRFTPIYDTTKEFYQLITSSDTTERAILNWIASNRASRKQVMFFLDIVSSSNYCPKSIECKSRDNFPLYCKNTR